MADDAVIAIGVFALIVVGLLAVVAIAGIPQEKAANCPGSGSGGSPHQYAMNETKAGALQCSVPASSGAGVVSLNGLVGALSAVVNDSSLTIANGITHITFALNTAHANTWTATQTVPELNINGGSECIAWHSSCYLCFGAFPVVYPCGTDDTIQLGSLTHRWYSVVSADFFVPAFSGDSVGAADLSYGSNGGTLSFGDTSGSGLDVLLARSGAHQFSVFTVDNTNTLVARLQVNGGQAQGSSDIVSYEPIILNPGAGLTGYSGTNVQLSASGVNFVINVPGASDIMYLNFAGSNYLNFGDTSMLPAVDSAYNIGSSSLRINNINMANNFNFYGTSGAANPILRITGLSSTIGALEFGTGGGSSLSASEFFLTAGQLGGINFQTLVSNAGTTVSILPNGNSNNAFLQFFYTSDYTTNYGFLSLATNGNDYIFQTNAGGSASLLPIEFIQGTTNVFELSTTGIANTQGFQSLTCSLASASTSTVCSLPVTEPDTNYRAVCNVDSATITAVSVANTSASTITLSYLTLGLTGGTGTCIVTHL